MRVVGASDQALLRQLNTRVTLRALRSTNEPATLTQLATTTTLSRQTVDAALSELVRRGWVHELPPDQPASGRPARRYAFHHRAGYVLGIDIGAHKALAVVADLSGQVLASHRTELGGDLPAADRLDATKQAADACLDSAGIAPTQLWAAAVGSTGIIRPDGRVRLSTVLPGWTGLNLAGRVADWYGRPTIADNDGNLAALAEHWRGAARTADDIVYVLAGHRTGAALMIDGRVHRGASGAAGEIGALLAVGWEDAPAILAEGGGADAVFAAAASGSAAYEIVDRFARVLAQGAAALVLAVDPELVVLGGGYSRSGTTLLEPFRRHLDDFCLSAPHVELSTMGEESVALGGIRCALDHIDTETFNLGTFKLGTFNFGKEAHAR